MEYILWMIGMTLAAIMFFTALWYFVIGKCSYCENRIKSGLLFIKTMGNKRFCDIACKEEYIKQLKEKNNNE